MFDTERGGRGNRGVKFTRTQPCLVLRRDINATQTRRNKVKARNLWYRIALEKTRNPLTQYLLLKGGGGSAHFNNRE